MKAKLILAVIVLLITGLILGSCTFRTCPTYAKAAFKERRI